MTRVAARIDRLPIESAAGLRRAGREARQDVPRAAHALYAHVERDPLAIIHARDGEYLQELLSLRRERLSASPFSFFRGTAGVMASDLVHQAVTGVHLVICGDAHLGNFGLYASPERHIVFDLNDFDEAAPGPWEWDLKRLLTSVVLAGQEAGLPHRAVQAAALRSATVYRTVLDQVLWWDALDRYFARLDRERVVKWADKTTARLFNATARRAAHRSSRQVAQKISTRAPDGLLRFIDDPPVLVRMPWSAELVQHVKEEYWRTVRPDIALLLGGYRLTDVARRVVGVGSVGTRCFIAALTGPAGEPLVLQIKEALPSVVAINTTPNTTTPHTLRRGVPEGRRIVTHQQILQAVSDPFLGNLEVDGRDYFVRQFRDMKGSFETSAMTPPDFERYAAECARLLARAHSQSPYAHWVAGYLGKSRSFDHAAVAWSLAYADQVQHDYTRYLASAS